MKYLPVKLIIWAGMSVEVLVCTLRGTEYTDMFESLRGHIDNLENEDRKEG